MYVFYLNIFYMQFILMLSAEFSPVFSVTWIRWFD